jgi:tRNA threonylcarbamoyladenosine biosynthesis protein TsaE
MEVLVTLENLNDFAARFWKYVSTSKVFAFYGQMGAGKTTLVTALCRYKGVKDTIGSPTFSIINEYSCPSVVGINIIYHIDLYRLKDEEEVVQAGVEDCIYSNNICMVEWPEKAPHLLDENVVNIFIEPVDEQTRKVKIDLPASIMQEQS